MHSVSGPAARSLLSIWYQDPVAESRAWWAAVPAEDGFGGGHRPGGERRVVDVQELGGIAAGPDSEGAVRGLGPSASRAS
jgi:hypothetical protein